ncbi:Rha family transcriptional regulator [Clostridium gasigenes]|uniref:Phage regulatory protein, rha family n=1 Tax=Clostridium gasigenes TaxID=94869 RepID=A0A1H0N3E5_9CLOT|nr:Rha family transcriptional regulator [Clostridium gasigenes]SDO87183.1 phage regulatory protein, rha family [Clostridium gasigenes]
MNNLTIVNKEGHLMVDSREVATMVEKEHKHLMRDIKGYQEILGQSNFGLTNFFIESTYITSQNKELPCYLLTRKGCDMVANKMTGEKGVLFTAEYVTQFEEMENKLKEVKQLSPMEIMKLQFEALEGIDIRVEKLENTMTIDYAQQEQLHRYARARLVKVLGGKESPAYKELSKKVFSNLWNRYKQIFKVSSYKNTAKKDFVQAIDYINVWEPSKEMGYMITGANSQIQFNN